MGSSLGSLHRGGSVNEVKIIEQHNNDNKSYTQSIYFQFQPVLNREDDSIVWSMYDFNNDPLIHAKTEIGAGNSLVVTNIWIDTYCNNFNIPVRVSFNGFVDNLENGKMCEITLAAAKQHFTPIKIYASVIAEEHIKLFAGLDTECFYFSSNHPNTAKDFETFPEDHIMVTLAQTMKTKGLLKETDMIAFKDDQTMYNIKKATVDEIRNWINSQVLENILYTTFMRAKIAFDIDTKSESWIAQYIKNNPFGKRPIITLIMRIDGVTTLTNSKSKPVPTVRSYSKK